MPDKNTRRIENLKRLLAPRHIAFIGGADADYSARQCAKRFKGPIWGVNPKRTEMGGQPCFASVQDLPEAPDAVFLATPRSSTLQVIQQLSEIGAGGVACFTAGYSETGEQGKMLEKELVDAAGDLALVGPNCYGLINYIRDAMLWPFGAGSCESDKGVALIMQSGMITADMAMNQRSVPLSYVISAGNQAMLAIEDYIDVLVDDEHVTGFGVYIEGIVDIGKFSAAALKALKAKKPIVLLKAGSSRIGSELAVSHTGSLSGGDEAHQALFDQLGVIRVKSPELMLETLKFMTISGIPAGNRIAAFTCSGGEALMVADFCEDRGLELPQPSAETFSVLTEMLPDIATVSNPLDYTTPLWGNEEIMPKVFEAALVDGFDVAIFIQDYPPEEFDADSSYYRADGHSYMRAVNAAGIPAGICSELSENFDRESREMYVAGGITPMQGFDRGLDAIQLSSQYGRDRKRILNDSEGSYLPLNTFSQAGAMTRLINEWQSKLLIKEAGISVPQSVLVGENNFDSLEHEVIEAGNTIGYPVVIKLVADELAHKSELGVVCVGVKSAEEANSASVQIRNAVVMHSINNVRGILIEEMVENSLHELLVGIKHDAQFGQVMVIASGGVLVELYKDSRTLLLPTTPSRIKSALESLQCFPLLTGYRGRPACDIDGLITTIMKLAHFAEAQADRLLEMDINPLMVLPDGVVAVDALITVNGEND
jgi:acyl-CoA synthetase (NDP forming)